MSDTNEPHPEPNRREAALAALTALLASGSAPALAQTRDERQLFRLQMITAIYWARNLGYAIQKTEPATIYVMRSKVFPLKPTAESEEMRKLFEASEVEKCQVPVGGCIGPRPPKSDVDAVKLALRTLQDVVAEWERGGIPGIRMV